MKFESSKKVATPFVGSENYSGKKEWEGMIEKEFTIVTYADVQIKDGKVNYSLKLNTDGKDSAKCPPVFLVNDQTSIPNDCNEFLKHVRNTLNSNK